MQGLINILNILIENGRCYAPHELDKMLGNIKIMKITKIDLAWLYYQLNEKKKLCFYAYGYGYTNHYIACPVCGKELYGSTTKKLRKVLREHLEMHLCNLTPMTAHTNPTTKPNHNA